MTSTMLKLDPSTTLWRKSSHSGTNACVEVAFIGGFVVLRDSKDPSGPTITLTLVEWNTFLGGVRNGEFDLLTNSKSAMKRAWQVRDDQITPFYSAHHRALRRYLIGQGCRASDADDIVQDSILIIRERWMRVSEMEHPKAYWFKIAIRLMWRRQRRDWNRFPATLDHEQYLRNMADTTDRIAIVDGQHAALSMVRHLAPRQRQVLWLRCIECFTEAETADILSVTRGTVKSQLYDAKANLKDLMSEPDVRR
jgi:RNA polymerase sigma factor (sigma-70 family)